jgi:hypothetical protein
MSAASPLHPPQHGTVTGTDGGPDRTVSVSADRLERLERSETVAALHAKHVQQLQTQVGGLETELKAERAHGEKHAEALVRVARSCDDRVDELKTHHAAALRVKDDAVSQLKEEFAALRASHAAAIAKVESETTALKAELEALKASHSAVVGRVERRHAAAIAQAESANATLRAELVAALHARDDAFTALTAKVETLKASHTAAISKLETQHAAAIATLQGAVAILEGQVTAVHGQTTSKLTDIHAAITAFRTLEFHPVRPDGRQFAEWRSGPVSACVAFGRDWCTRACGTDSKVEIDADTGMRAHVTSLPRYLFTTHDGRTGFTGSLTLRSAAPLPRRVSRPLVADGRQQDQLPAYRIVVEAYDQRHYACSLGFVPSHHMADAGAPVTPKDHHFIWQYGGWCITVDARSVGSVDADVQQSGWTVLEPARGAVDECDSGSTSAAATLLDGRRISGYERGVSMSSASVPFRGRTGMQLPRGAGNAVRDTSAYATTSTVPPVPAGSAVEFAVDYAAGTCRVAFYTPEAVAGGFVEAPHAKMELRFVATDAKHESDYTWTAPEDFLRVKIPARPVPADSGVELYPAVMTPVAGVIWRFAT